MAIVIPDIIGLPPSTYQSDKVMESSFPIAEIKPSELRSRLNTNNGASFYLANVWSKYSDLLASHGFTISNSQGPLKVAFLADNFPSDAFSNEYQASFLSRLQETASFGVSSVAQMMGTRTATDAVNLLKRLIPNQAQPLINKVEKGIKQALQPLGQGIIGNLTKTLDATLAGARLDFPLLWANSSFQPSYTMTIRLYNPKPGDTESTKKYIIGPLAALLLLGIPLTEDGFSYSWPFVHKVKVKGIWELRGAFISNITVIKGGDQQQIGKNQRMGIVDVRIDFNSLYSSMIGGNIDLPGRTTLKSYLDNMEEDKPAYNYLTSSQSETQEGETTNSGNLAPLQESSSNIETVEPRVSEDAQNVFQTLSFTGTSSS